MLSNAERQARWRNGNREKVAARRPTYDKTYRAKKPQAISSAIRRRFIALDGEGGGIDATGRQRYQLLRAGDATGHFARSLSIHNLPNVMRREAERHRLPTEECLDFILDLPKDATIVGFFFGYDVTMILRDLPRDRLEHLFSEKIVKGNRYTYWRQFGIEYLPKQYFRVCRINRDTLKVIPGSSRTINEVGGFFQQSFVEALKNWEIGEPAMIEMIAAQKDRREQFTEIGATEDAYCKAECKLLAQLMNKFRDVCVEANIVPRQWRGAGHISARLHELHKTPVRKKRQRWKIIDKLAEDAYYGGRFEITTIGRIAGAVWEYDIRSAYPAAMLQLPCPVHGKWRRFGSEAIPESGSIYVADISFRHSDRSFLCGFPIREKGRLYFPKMGSGVYWSPEIEAATRAGATVSISGGYRYLKKCDCRPFNWVNDLFLKRIEIGSKTKGYPIKLGLNGLYGKFAQRIGGAPYRDYVMAGLITAFTRAKIIDAYAPAPQDILYIATDAIYSRTRLDYLDIGPGLGQWEETRRDGMFIVQPGIYWSGDVKPKTRGIPRSIVIENRDRFEQAWNIWLAQGAIGAPPAVPVFVNQFIGLRAALARGKPELAGTWLSDLREIMDDRMRTGIRDIDFDWQNKRRPFGDYINGDCMVTQPFPGRETLRSQGYDGELITEFNAQLIEREDDPDFYPWGNSGE